MLKSITQLTATFLFAAVFVLNTSAQTAADFENFGLGTDMFLNGNDKSGGFESGNIYLPNSYNANYDSWFGWAISSMTDTETPGFGNQYSSIAGEGVAGSSTYAVSYSIGPTSVLLQEDARGQVVQGLYVTNSTYAYLSIQDGDTFAKKFGGETGNDPDWFRLTFKAYSDGELGTDSIDFYLADYRFDDNTQDYIVDSWEWIDLASLGQCDSLWVNLWSTDIGLWGMNTPAQVCIDDVTTEEITSTLFTAESLPLDAYPNPATDWVTIDWNGKSTFCEILDINGRVVLTRDMESGANRLDIREIPSGIYTAVVSENGELYVARIAK